MFNQYVIDYYKSKTVSVIIVATIKILMIFITQGSHDVLKPNQHFSLLAKVNGA